MSRPRYYWWGSVLAALRQYPKGLPDDTEQGRRAYEAIVAAINETKYQVDGPDRIKLVNMVFIKNTHTYAGGALKLNISERTAQRWLSEFVYRVADNMGYLP